MKIIKALGKTIIRYEDGELEKLLELSNKKKSEFLLLKIKQDGKSISKTSNAGKQN